MPHRRGGSKHKKGGNERRSKSRPKMIHISPNEMQLFMGLQKTGASRVFGRDWGTKKDRTRVMEYSGFLDFDEDGLEKVIVEDRGHALDELNARDYDEYPLYTPRVYNYTEDYEYNFHTHPGMRFGTTMTEEVHSGDVAFFAENAKGKGHTQGELVFAPEGIYGIFPLTNPSSVKELDDKIINKMHLIELRISRDFEKKYRGHVNRMVASILGEKSNFDGEKRIKELERQLKDTDDIIKAMKIKDKIDDINRVLLESMFIIVVPNIKKDLIVPMNKLYEEVGIYVDFFPIKFDKKTKSWRYTGLKVPVTVYEGFKPTNRSKSKAKSHHGIKVSKLD